MSIDPGAVGVRTAPQLVEWSERETLLYALGVGAGVNDLAFTTENSHDIEQQVLPTYAVIACPAWDAADAVGTYDMSKLLHGSQSIRLFEPLPPTGRLHVVSEVVDIQDKGLGRNAVLVFKGTGRDPDTGKVIAETVSTAVVREAGGFGGQPGVRASTPEVPARRPDACVALRTREDQALLYRLSGDRNPLHSDPWFATELAGFPRPILHGLCTYGVAGRALVTALGRGDAAMITAMTARFTSPVFPGEILTTSIWCTEPGRAVFRTEASEHDDAPARVVLDDGLAEFRTGDQAGESI